MGAVLMEPPVTVEHLLSLPKEIQSDLMSIFAVIYEKKFTGAVTFHCHQGVPKTAQIPAPHIRLTDVP